MEISARGYANKPKADKTKAGKPFSSFSLGVKQKDKNQDGTERVTWANFFVKDYNNSSPPPEKSFVTVTGFLKVREYEKDGEKRTALEVVAKTVEVSPSLDGGSSKPAKEATDDFSDIPF